MDPSWIDIGGVPCAPGSEVTTEQRVENGSDGRITAGAPLTPRRMRLRGVIEAGDMLMLRYERA